MARFGLSDSDSDEDQQVQASTSRSPTPNNHDGSARGTQTARRTQQPQDDHDHDDEHDDHNNDDDDDDAPPPRASLNDDDDDEDDEAMQDEEEDEDELDGRSTRETSFVSSTQHSTLDGDPDYQDDEDDDDRSDSFSTSTASVTPRKRHHNPVAVPPFASRDSATTTTNNGHLATSWPSKLRLEPKRVAVMQASFFQQQQHHHQQPAPASTKAKYSATTMAANGESSNSHQPKAAPSPFNVRSNAAAPTPVAAATSVPTPAIDPSPFRPYRKYARVELENSITNGQEGNLVDLGLALGRSFRVGWGPQGQIVHLDGGLYDGAKASKPDMIKIDRLKLVSTPETNSTLRVLELQLAHTPIYANSPESSVPFAVPHPELRFSHFVQGLSPSDRSAEANLWRLGHALFDEIDDLSIPPEALAEDPHVASYIEELRRKDRLEKWLEDVVQGEVGDDVRQIDDSARSDAPAAKRMFALLSGHQIERACEAAIEAGDLRLATLLAQAGGDDDFREDVFLQLVKWREYRVDAHIATAYRRVYELLCGNVGVSEGRGGVSDKVDGAEEVHVAQGLGWKRAFGLHLWYASFRSSVTTAMDRYESAFKTDQRVARPEPDYLLSPTSEGTTWSNRSGETPTDPLFEMIKLFTSPTHALEQALLPIHFGPSPLDYRLPWHLYILLSRVLRRRDFEDRVQVDVEAEGKEIDEGGAAVEGNSVRADLMTESYANQLEQLGLWQWAMFVLLHLELPEARSKALRSLLSRSTTLLTPETFDFLVQRLHIPQEWIFHAQAISTVDRFEKYDLHLLARDWVEAHRIVIDHLGPEAILRNDLGLLKRLLQPFDERRVEDWEMGAGLLGDYVELLEVERRWQEEIRSGKEAMPDAIEGEKRGRLVRSVLERLSRKDLVGTPRTRKARVARDEMTSRLTVIATAVEGALNKIQPSTLQESDRLVWIRGASNAFLAKSLQAACP